METINRENALLATFLYADDFGIDKTDAFILDSNIFTSSYRRALANKINDETKGDKFYGYLLTTVGDLTVGTKFGQEYMDILDQTPLCFSVAKRYYDDLEVAYKERIVKGLR